LKLVIDLAIGSAIESAIELIAPKELVVPKSKKNETKE
jgi:hypothetical protein